jgi:hypothetical protein
VIVLEKCPLFNQIFIPADKTLVSTDKSYNFVGILQKKKMF